MRPDRVSYPGPLTYESGDQPTARRGPEREREREREREFAHVLLDFERSRCDE